MPEGSTLRFNPRARLIRTVGDKLISGPEAAIIELVKNAHDADASFARVRIEPGIGANTGLIVVEDDGHGMSLDDIQEKWMEPATTDKSERRRSPKGRPLLGSKGIGRFAAAKLGRRLELKSTAELPHDVGKQTTILPEVDWDLFETKKYLSEIAFEYQLVEPEEKTGTQLRITELRNRWSKDSLDRLHREMRRLVSPLEETERGFGIYLDLSAFHAQNYGFDGASIVNGVLPDAETTANPHRVQPFPLMTACDYEVAGSFAADGTFEGTLTVHRAGQQPTPIELRAPVLEELDEASCGEVLVQLYIFDREDVALAEMAKRAGWGSLKAKEARQILDQVTGISIYRDGFRIRPYGDNDADWLTLDKRRVQNPSLCIGHNQISGILVVDNEARSGLVERSSREGLEETGSFRRLQRLMLELLARVVEPTRAKFREDAGLSRRRKDTFIDAFKSAQLRRVQLFVKSLPDEQRKEGEKVLADEILSLDATLQSLQAKQADLEAKVTLGLIVAEVLHEGRNPVYFIQTESARLAKYWPTLRNDTAEAHKNWNDIPRITRGLHTGADKLRALFASLEPLAGARGRRPTMFNPNQVVIDTLHLLESRAKDAKTELIHRADPDIKDAHGFREDLATALTNLVENGIYWLGHHKVQQAEILVKVATGKDSCVIDVMDNGPGIPDEFRDRIFDVGFTLKPNGTGLGLSIAKEAIGRSGGSIGLIDSERGAHFRITMSLGG